MPDRLDRIHFHVGRPVAARRSCSSAQIRSSGQSVSPSPAGTSSMKRVIVAERCICPAKPFRCSP